MTQTEVAAEITRLAGDARATGQGYVSKAESGRLAVSGDRLELYAKALGYPSDLLRLNDDLHGAGVGLIHHRRKASLTRGDLRRIHALLNLTRIQVGALIDVAGERPADRFPSIKVDDFDTAEDAAHTLRTKWGLPDGPVASVVAAIEAAGGIVVHRPLAGRALDAVSLRPAASNPVFLLRNDAPGDRQRFTLAHELGHLTMHEVPSADQERQADEFAAEFLMPAKDIRSAFKGRLDLHRLFDLKATWRVSASALLRRAHTLSMISDWQYRQMNVELSTLGYRTEEPGGFPQEKPGYLPDLLEHLQRERGMTVAKLAQLVRLCEEEFGALYLDQPPDSM